jgi:hypothetical protein
MEYGNDLDIANARQANQELKLSHIPNLPTYPASPATACRVGRIISAHALYSPWNSYFTNDLTMVLASATSLPGTLTIALEGS